MSDIEFYNTIIACKDVHLSSQINISLGILADALRLYGPSNVVASYNGKDSCHTDHNFHTYIMDAIKILIIQIQLGGKDADVVMHLMRAAMANYKLQNEVFHSYNIPKSSMI